MGSSLQIGCAKIIVFAGATELIQAAGALILVGTAGENVTTAPGDLAIAVALAGGVFALAYLPVTPVTAGLPEAPADGLAYARQVHSWTAIPNAAMTAPVAPLTVNTAGTTAVPAGCARVFVTAMAPVTLELPPNDCLVMDRGPQAGTSPITCMPPVGSINGQPYYALVGDWDSAQFIWDGTTMGVIAG